MEKAAPRASLGTLEFGVERLALLPLAAVARDAHGAIDELRRDRVVLVKGATQSDADALLLAIACGLGLRERLELQAGLAAHQDHRRRVGRFFMTVNARKDREFISAHSEGTSAANIQLSSFFCAQNSTDGGETILLNVDPAAGVWDRLREKAIRIAPTSQPTPGGIARAKVQYNLDGANALPKNDDVVIGPRGTDIQGDIPGLDLIDVLAKPVKTRSAVLQDERFAYWDSIASTDESGLDAFAAVLERCGLLRRDDAAARDNCAPRRVWRSGADHLELFRYGIHLKLEPGDFIVQNNLTWAHGAASWTPESGVRTMVAAFA